MDTLISLMTLTWLSMIAEGVTFSDSCAQPHTLSSLSANSHTGLTYTERESLCAVGGCFHCCLTPKSPGWMPHLAVNCPGNKALGIPPCAPSTALSSKNGVFSISAHIDEPSLAAEAPETPVLAVFPPQSNHGVHLVLELRYGNEDGNEDEENYVLGWNPQKGRCNTDSKEDMTRSNDAC